MCAETKLMIGVGDRQQLAAWLESRPWQIECLEVRAYKGCRDRFLKLGRHYRLILRVDSFPLGRTKSDGESDWIFEMAGEVHPEWICAPLGFSRTSEVVLEFPHPFSPTIQNLNVLRSQIQEIMQRSGTIVLLENSFSFLAVRGPLSEAAFLNALCRESGCGMLVNVPNLFVHCKIHGINPRRWMDEIDTTNILQMNVGSHTCRNQHFLDLRHYSVEDEIFEFAEELARRSSIRAFILERDGNFPPASELESDLRRIRQVALASPR
jgi:uncharacterized protein (UPF0276 family)